MTGILQQNLDLLRQKGMADLAQQLARHQPHFPLTGKLEDGSLNFQLDASGRKMYLPDILTAATQEVEDYLKDPIRLYLPIQFQEEMHRQEDLPDWDESGRLINDQFNNAIARQLKKNNLLPDTSPHSKDGGYLLSFGLGIGLQLALYLDHLPVRNLILIEPELDILHHSFRSINWAGFFQRIEERNGTIKFITNPNPMMAGAEAVHAMRGRDFSLVDGSYITQHYNSDYMNQALQAFQASYQILHHGFSFVEDEILMYRNGYTNIKQNVWRGLPAGTPQRLMPLPAFVIGSGPSLDNSIPFLKENRDKAVYISGGTAMSALIKNGIYPDFHCETENTAYTPKVLKDIGTENLRNTILIATNTVQPEITKWFKDVIFCTRDSVTPTRLYHKPSEMISLAAANVTCLSSRAAMAFGFQNIILFGTDFGSLNPAQHHSKSSIYNTKTDKFYNRGFKMPKFDIEIPGITQKTVYTNTYFQFARQFLEKLFTTMEGFNIYNTAKGAQILGSQAVDLNQISLNLPFSSRQELVDRLLSGLDVLPMAAKFDATQASSFKANLHLKMSEILEKTKDALTFEDYYLYLRDQMQQGESDQEFGEAAAIRCITSGSFIQFLQHLDWLRKRLSHDEWKNFWPIARQELVTHTQMVDEKLAVMFEEIRHI